MEFEKTSERTEIVLPEQQNPCTCACNSPNDGDPKSAKSDKTKANLTKSSGGCSSNS